LNDEQAKKESNHQEQLDKSLLRYNNLNDYVKLLEKKVEDLSKNENNNSDDKNEKKLLPFFELMTSMTVATALLNKKDIYSCTIKNDINRRITKFNITLESDQLIFEPKANSNMLPEYLREGITGEARMAPVILGDILQQVYEDKEE
jgi:hypothetical protein